jgi:hypothetical protein
MDWRMQAPPVCSLEPKDAGPQDGAGGGVKITINLGNDPRDARVIEATTIEAEDATAIEH